MRAARLPAESKDPLPLRTATGLDRNSHANVSPISLSIKKASGFNPVARTHFLPATRILTTESRQLFSPLPFRFILNAVSAVRSVVIRQPSVRRWRRPRLSHPALRISRSRQLPAPGICPAEFCNRRISITLLKRLWNRWCRRFRIDRTAHNFLLQKKYL